MQKMLYQECRPESIDDYVFVDKDMETKFKEWIDTQYLPNIILAGPPGTGKTSVSYLLCKEIGFDGADVRTFDGSTDTGVDIVRERIRPFVETVSHNELGRVVIIEEFDRLSKNSQDSLKCIMIDNMDNARFILLTNNIHRVDSAIVSRCHVFQIEALNKDQYMLRVASVL